MGDFSRETFDPRKDFAGVLMQQGRVQLDADWNELVEILDRRLRAEAADVVGRCVVPKETPDGFKIDMAGGQLLIYPGRIYVDGLLAENHGREPFSFDPVLAEENGDSPISYEEQPYFLSPEVWRPLPTSGGPHLVYIDVWRREATYLEFPEVFEKAFGLIEKAVGSDTTTRLQTVWQVKVLANVGAGVNCRSKDDDVQGWNDLRSPSAGRLTTAVVPSPTDQGPCLIPPGGGYRGVDNHLYRVEIHDGGPASKATFKWSRDNRWLATSVTEISSTLDKLTVARTMWDQIQRFQPEDWVEITDDRLEFQQLPGVMAKIKIVDDIHRTITLHQPLYQPSPSQPPIFPTDGGITDPNRHTRVIRWDQKGLVPVTESDGTVTTFDLDKTGGVIPVKTSHIVVILENGVEVTLTFDPTGGSLHSGDYWTFAARTVDTSVEPLANAPPRGIHHHYGRLAMWTLPSKPDDCRIHWPPDTTGDGCDCSVCVTAESHNNGTQTIQWAVDKVKATGGTVCLGAGTYDLASPINLNQAYSIRLRGQGSKTRLQSGFGPLVAIEKSLDVTIEDLSLVAPSTQDSKPAISIRDSFRLTVQRCIIDIGLLGASPTKSSAISLNGWVSDALMRENIIYAPIGIGTFQSVTTSYTIAPGPTKVPLGTTVSPMRTAAAPLTDSIYSQAARAEMEQIPGFDTALAQGPSVAGGQAPGTSSTPGGGVSVAQQTVPLGELIGVPLPIPHLWLRIEDNVFLCTSQGISLGDVSQYNSEIRVKGNLLFDCADGGIVAIGQTTPDFSLNIMNNEIHPKGPGPAMWLSSNGLRVGNNDISPFQTGGGSDGIVLGTGVGQAQILSNRIAKIAGNGILILGTAESIMIKQNIINGVGMGGIVMGDRSSANDLNIENNELSDIALSTVQTTLAAIVLKNTERAELVNNGLVGFNQNATQKMSRAGIRLFSISNALISNNELTGIGPPDQFLGESIGIDCSGTFNRLNVNANHVQRGQNPPLQQDYSQWIALRIGPTVPRLMIAESNFNKPSVTLSKSVNPPTSIPTANPSTNVPPAVTPTPPGITVQGNQLEGYGGDLLSINTQGMVILANNHCLSGSFTNPVAEINVGGIIISENYLWGPGEISGVIVYLPSNGPYNILGNITSQKISILGGTGPPHATLDSLNVVSPPANQPPQGSQTKLVPAPPPPSEAQPVPPPAHATTSEPQQQTDAANPPPHHRARQPPHRKPPSG